ncbi:class I SAM-dependent methyltransferase, partial [candidate division KSB1 bacterium]|nr:class I SAM-dependent methyltransferase [candidate division KSB1 bacterium]
MFLLQRRGTNAMAFVWDFMARIYRPLRRVWPFSAMAAAEHEQLTKLAMRAVLNRLCIGVDLGCGVGHARKILPPEAVVFGVDRSFQMALRAADAGYQAVVVADIRCLPFAAQFDFIVCV